MKKNKSPKIIGIKSYIDELLNHSIFMNPFEKYFELFSERKKSLEFSISDYDFRLYNVQKKISISYELEDFGYTYYIKVNRELYEKTYEDVTIKTLKQELILINVYYESFEKNVKIELDKMYEPTLQKIKSFLVSMNVLESNYKEKLLLMIEILKEISLNMSEMQKNHANSEISSLQMELDYLRRINYANRSEPNKKIPNENEEKYIQDKDLVHR